MDKVHAPAFDFTMQGHLLKRCKRLATLRVKLWGEDKGSKVGVNMRDIKVGKGD